MNKQVETGKHILIVDDDTSVAGIIAMLVELLGYTGTVLNEPAKALELFRREHFDLVLTDFAMPGMNGGELTRRIKQCSPSTPVVLITGFSGRLPLDQVDAVLPKPMNLDDLRTVLARVLSRAA